MILENFQTPQKTGYLQTFNIEADEKLLGFFLLNGRMWKIYSSIILIEWNQTVSEHSFRKPELRRTKDRGYQTKQKMLLL